MSERDSARCALPFAVEHQDTRDGHHAFLRGTLTDSRGEPAIGATVVATGCALVGEQIGLTDETGAFDLGALPPGRYEITTYFENRVGVHPATIGAGVITIDHVRDAELGCVL